MGKGTDKMYITHSEWSGQFGGMQFGGIQKRTERDVFKRLPFDYCSLSLQPFEHPVCAPDGIIFDLKNIYPFLKKHGTNPVTGEKLEPKSLIKLNFHKNSNDEYHCPATYRVFNDHTHIVAIKTTGNVYSYEAIDRLNIKTKNWKDLLEDDPHNLESRNLTNFHYIKNDLKIDEDKSDKPLNDINIEATGSAALVLTKIASREDENKEITSKSDSHVNKDSSLPSSKPKSSKNLPYNAASYTCGLASASLTSTAFTPVTENENALIDKEEFMFKEIKSKGYVRIVTNLGNLNVELFCEKIQGGDPTGTGKGGESYWKKEFPDEFKSNLSHNERGLLIGGNEVLDKMESLPTDSSDRPLDEIKIIEVTVFVDPYEEYNKRLERKLSRQKDDSSEKNKIKSLKDEKESTTNWFGTKLTTLPSNRDQDIGVGKYLKSINNKRDLDSEDLNIDYIPEQIPKKSKHSGNDFDFSSW
ncbi:1281_t:CDS:10 [Diversispora eburnea]|uniref:RING-type E3 ubiquitin transferase n=1 Tax=Diversispora eburnea TaxID=1213867 RepID=A0A9N9ACG3_9GLOM|nr:1281_t:CDS:10 [Diversispora eburnea]